MSAVYNVSAWVVYGIIKTKTLTFAIYTQGICLKYVYKMEIGVLIMGLKLMGSADVWILSSRMLFVLAAE